MDLYRLLTLSQSPQGCEGRLHITELLKCSYPIIDAGVEDYGRREPKMFFSRTRLDVYFGQFVNALLACECPDCEAAKNDDMDMLWVSGMTTQVQTHPWILGFMIYLGKLHYIYYWMKWEFFDSNGVLQEAIKDDRRLRRLIEPEFGRSIFQEAYSRAFSMFHPMKFEIKDNENCPYRDLSDTRRFPYSKEEPISTKGFYGVMTRVEILPEHLNERMIGLIMRKYPTSVINAGSGRKFLFALKSVRMKNPDSPLRSMERNVLDMVSRIEGPAAENMITLLFAYKWKEQIHFLFPFIEMNLDQVLRHQMCPGNHPSKLGPDEQLPNHWLWREMKGVCSALSVFHREMENPFPNVEGTVIGLHFDLKPANILVTAGGKLKITDFGQSIIQILGKGEDLTIPHSPGDSRYAAPESRPTLDYSRNEPEEIAVLLNYDVWSLGCIMVEVLIHLLDQQTLQEFDQILAEEPNPGFSTNADLKEGVKSSLESFQQKFLDDAQRQYMVAITELIRRMLRQDVAERPYSWEVFDDLQTAETILMELPIELDVISPAVKEYELRDGSGFRELGWDNGNSIVSFADMTGVTLKLVHQKNGHREEAKPCRIRLFRKSSRSLQVPIEIALVWAIKKGVIVELDQRRYPASRWRFTPTYLFQDGINGNGRFGCRLFPIIWPPGQCKSSDRAFIFQFETLQDVLTFQGALIQKRILPPIRATVEGMRPKRSSLWSRERQSPVFNQQVSHIQLWGECEPKYVDRRRSTATSISSSVAQTGMTRQHNEEQCSRMIVFFQRLSPLDGTVNDGHKLFQATGNSHRHSVNIVNRRTEGHESFSVRQLPAYPAWQSEDLDETSHASSSIMLETDYEQIIEYFKMEAMDIELKSPEGEIVYVDTVTPYSDLLSDLKRFYRATISEWRSYQ